MTLLDLSLEEFLCEGNGGQVDRGSTDITMRIVPQTASVTRADNQCMPLPNLLSSTHTT